MICEDCKLIEKNNNKYKRELAKLAFEIHCWNEMPKDNFKFSNCYISYMGTGAIVFRALQQELKDGEKNFEDVLERIIKERNDLQKKWDALPDHYKDGLPDWFDAAH